VSDIKFAPSPFGKTPIPAASLKKKTRGGRFGFYLSDILEGPVAEVVGIGLA
jgi:hypothetical protein